MKRKGGQEQALPFALPSPSSAAPLSRHRLLFKAAIICAKEMAVRCLAARLAEWAKGLGWAVVLGEFALALALVWQVFGELRNDSTGFSF